MSEVILHVGQAKTGTTTIQYKLWKGHLENLSHGVLYPSTNHIRDTHHFLAPLWFPRDQIADHVIRRMGFNYENCLRLAREEWDFVLEQCQKEPAPKVVLSSESFFRQITSETASRMLSMTSQLRSDLRILAYIRNPVERYLSSVQQGLKTRSVPVPIELNQAIDRVDSFRSNFGSAFEVRAFERDRLLNKDVFEDFCAWASLNLPPSKVTISEKNRSISAEAMSALNRMGRRTAAIDQAEYSVQKTLFKTIEAVDFAISNPTKPRMKVEISELLTRMSTEVLPLRDRFGLLFSGLDYNIVGKDGPREIPEIFAVEQICDFNMDRRDALEAEVKRRLNPSFLRRVARRLKRS